MSDESNTPEGLRYTEEHEWVREDGDIVRVGITDFAQQSLGAIVYVDLPSTGVEITQGQPFGEVESTKSVSDLFAPISGTIVERNEALDERPELINDDPYGEGWIITLAPSDRAQLDGLQDAATYAASVT